MITKTDPSPAQLSLRKRLFAGTFPTGISYADRQRERAGDYAPLAFLHFDTLQLDVEPDCPPDLKALIESDAAAIQARRGESFQVSAAGQTVRLGSALPVDAKPLVPTDSQREILRHALGLNRKGSEFRNHFVTGPGSTDYPDCEALVSAGLMTKRDGSPLSGGDPVYNVTEAGKLVARRKPPVR